jgi:hypothetical protein
MLAGLFYGQYLNCGVPVQSLFVCMPHLPRRLAFAEQFLDKINEDLDPGGAVVLVLE